jgi:hypothetical protein
VSSTTDDPAQLLDRLETVIPTFIGRCRPLPSGLVRPCRAGHPDGLRPFPPVRGCGHRRLSASAGDRSQWAAKSAGLVNAMSTLLRLGSADERPRVPTRLTALAGVNRTNATRDRLPQTLTVPLITRRSQVQILPPPPSNTSSEVLFAQRGGPLRLPCANEMSTSRSRGRWRAFVGPRRGQEVPGCARRASGRARRLGRAPTDTTEYLRLRPSGGPR